MQLAIDDLPIEHVPSESPLSKDREKMYWLGQSGKTYHYLTLKGLVKRNLLQFIQSGFGSRYAHLIKKDPIKHNTTGYLKWNQQFL